MKVSSAFSALLVAGPATAQTPAGFTPSVSTRLDLTFGSKNVATPGTALTKSDTAQPPTLGLATQPNGTYLWLMILMRTFSAPYAMESPPPMSDQHPNQAPLSSTNFANPQAGQPSTYLHTVIRDFKATGQTTSSGIYTLSSTATGPVSWFGPAPGAENPPHPHRYTNLLWEQPANWVIPQAANTQLQNQKLGFNVEDFIQAAGLSVPIAANYFNVTG
ncbi:phosphatidylethanolamine-binding protein [Pseudomassariella vexata]|uniref:Phosphatidylethanolamine-binding protein n=1 Tax=Pseudomassariella vexata TaxID=1141098 RepID=A0A1Y2DE18_9PEZI|nr:phosphatidylethanolamine-binding protein [Pseudomassariella vexata]ORY57521.1 phosphatidylethanolamine-binding protein [Pseudomassariella vexata]